MPEHAAPTVLILGGTAEAVALANACARQWPNLRVITSLAGRTRAPVIASGETHRGGFGGVQGLQNFVQRRHIAALIDATHPFAAQISRHALLACEALGVAHLQLLREPWQATERDRWLHAADMADAAQLLARHFAPDSARDERHHQQHPGPRVFLSTGRQQLQAFAALQHPWYLIRTVDPLPAPAPFAHCAAITARGPFSIDNEHALFIEHAIDVLISKNSGGEATAAKIHAARELGLPVIMVQRPPPPAATTVSHVDAALTWLRAHL